MWASCLAFVVFGALVGIGLAGLAVLCCWLRLFWFGIVGLGLGLL